MKKLNDFIDVARELKKNKTNLKLCPRCGSISIRLSNNLGFWLTPAVYICEKCGYNGPIVLELEKDNKTHSHDKHPNNKGKRVQE
jgi:predicted RNA-binding Zn-ribbon protein involved in translation (DUF1610 family)